MLVSDIANCASRFIHRGLEFESLGGFVAWCARVQWFVDVAKKLFVRGYVCPFFFLRFLDWREEEEGKLQGLDVVVSLELLNLAL